MWCLLGLEIDLEDLQDFRLGDFLAGSILRREVARDVLSSYRIEVGRLGLDYSAIIGNFFAVDDLLFFKFDEEPVADSDLLICWNFSIDLGFFSTYPSAVCV